MAETRRYSVTGMSCDHCERAVRTEVEQLQGVSELQVSAETGWLEISVAEGSTLTDDAVLAAVDEAGYDAAPQPAPQP